MLALSVSSGIVLTACTIFVDSSRVQCAVSDDCAGLGFTNHTCGADGLCRETQADAATAIACKSSSECQGVASTYGRCVDGSCVDMRTPECDEVFGTLTDESIVVGVIAPKKGLLAAASMDWMRAVRLAVKDFNAGIGARPGDARTIAVVACDEADSTMPAVLTHLVKNANVRQVVGPARDEAVAAALGRAEGERVVFMAPFAVAPSLWAGPSAARLWSIAPNLGTVARASKGGLEVLLSEIRKGVPGFVNRTGILVPNETGAMAWAAAVTAQNGFDASVPYETYDDWFVAGDGFSPTPVAVQALDRTILLGSASPTGNLFRVMRAVESTAQSTGVDRPFFLTFGRHPELLTIVDETALVPTKDGGTPGPAASRVLAIDLVRAPASRQTEDTFEQRFRQENGLGGGTSIAAGSEAYFDAMWTTLLAVHAGRGPGRKAPQDVGAAEFSDGIAKLSVDGAVGFRPGLDAVSSALSSIVDGPIDLIGASGALSFDASLHSPVDELELLCITGASTLSYVSTSVSFDRITGEAKGAFQCSASWP